MVRDRFSLSKLNSFTLPSRTISTTLIIYMLLNMALGCLVLLSPTFGLIVAMGINLLVVLSLQPKLALPLYILVADTPVILSVSGSGILSRLYIGNLLFMLIVVVWLVRGTGYERKAGLVRWEPRIVLPLMGL